MEQIPKYRNMFLQVVLFIITFGIYGVYWFYQTCVEMKELTHDEEAAPGMWTVLMFIPLVNFYAIYRYSDLFERVSGEKVPSWGLFLLWIFFAPAVWIIVQLELNRKADETLRSRVYAT